ncbi:hypothetical protein K438DRAFT_1865495 [Mycena galopus ATCC 62051]|nr:hypothetical protein K438DRAFT_1865495 [Mycena galopus ATCC 62051]
MKEIHPQVFLAFITSALKLQFSFTSMRMTWDPMEISAISPPPPPTLTELLLGEHADDVGEVLSHPQFAPYMAKLQRLSVRILKQPPVALLSVAPVTLTHVSLDCRGFNRSHFSAVFPPLPHLRSLEILLDVARRTEPWFIESISQILAFSNSNSNSGGAHEISVTISYSAVGRYRASHLYTPVLHALETFLLSHPARPSLVWRLGYGAKETGFANFADLVDVLQQATPTLHGKGRLAIENFVLDGRVNI